MRFAKKKKKKRVCLNWLRVYSVVREKDPRGSYTSKYINKYIYFFTDLRGKVSEIFVLLYNINKYAFRIELGNSMSTKKKHKKNFRMLQHAYYLGMIFE